ncbi:adhesion G-protein coupled receptor D2-like isoform X1 [Amblyraja radiata]|uniref:adhesion G-protein coupled receptor D2-like isoform X1 n=1 Tax=Amblyraja radiata TaxID=386614 RepID=UPI0014041C45|nr:adhesion G-protein coupled receptor D2-like isoform X1 [Amblyraja radiata]
MGSGGGLGPESTGDVSRVPGRQLDPSPKKPEMVVGANFPCAAVLFLYVSGALVAAESRVAAGDTPCVFHRHYYCVYRPERLRWAAAEKLCRQRFGFLASVATADDNLRLSGALRSVGVTESLWIGARVRAAAPGTFGSHILTFATKTDTKYAKLLLQFPQMHSVTICAQVQFEASYVGVSTVFSYSIPSFINEFQLRANIVHEQQIQLALLVHGVHTPYSQAVENDGRWHHVCLSWSSHGGTWAIAADGSVIASGDHLYISGDIGAGGVFIIGQEQDTFGGSFKKDESFIGNVTQLHIWDRLLNASEIHVLAGNCLVVPLGLYFQWNLSVFEVEPTVQMHKGFSQCKGDGFQTTEPFDVAWVDGTMSSFHNISSDVGRPVNKGECVAFNPLSAVWTSEDCSKQKHALCRYGKEVYEQMQVFTSLPPSALYLHVKEKPTDVSMADYLLLNRSDYPRDMMSANVLASVLVEAVDESGLGLTAADLLALTRFLGNVAQLDFEAEGNNSETVLSLATNYVKLASKMIDAKCSLEWLMISEVIPGPYVIIQSVDMLTERLSSILLSIKPSIVLSTDNIDVQMKASRLSSVEAGLVYKPTCLSARDRVDEIQVPGSEMSRLLTLGYNELIFIHVYYRSVENHLAPHNVDSVLVAGRKEKSESSRYNVIYYDSNLQASQLQTAVISSTVRDPVRARNIPTAVQYSLSHRPVVGFSKFATPACVFWNFSLQDGRFVGWSSQGCHVIRAESDITVCFCSHTTNFAVLMQFTEIQWGVETETVLNKLTFIGSGASLCALVVTLILFTVLDIPKSDRTSIHKNLFVALIAAQMVLLSSDSATDSKTACTAVTALLHLFFMAAFAWMMVEGLLLWSKVVTVNLSEERRMKYYYFIGWGIPVLIVTITLAAAHDKYIADRYCWLNVHNGVIWAFVGPVIFIIMVNIFVLTRVVLITMTTAKRRASMLAVNSSPMEQAYDQIRAAVKAVLVLLPILGLTWLCGVLVPLSVVMAYTFVILNSLQGLFIFLIYGVYNTEVRSTIKRLQERRKALNFSNCATSRPSSSLTSSRPASSPVTGSESLAKDEIADGVNLQGICKMSFYDNSVIYENTTAANERQMSTPSLPAGADDELSSCSQSPSTCTKGCKAADPLAGGQENKEDVCSLHVPLELEDHSCLSLNVTTIKRVGSLYLD